MAGTWKRRGAVLALVGGLLVGAIVAGANASTSLDRALATRHDLRAKIDALHQERHDRRLQLHQWIVAAKTRLAKINRTAAGRTLSGTFHHQASKERGTVVRLTKRERTLVRDIRARVAQLRAQRTQLADWIATYGIFRVCPVDGPHTVANNFGVVVDLPGVPVHIHQGNDISAPSGTPIVAPFDGNAVASRNVLGGLSVSVYGPLGHVYNAHLSAYGHLGSVTAGTVIGYVGTTGDATGPHDHFEWHPGDGPAVDPNPFLAAVC